MKNIILLKYTYIDQWSKQLVPTQDCKSTTTLHGTALG